MFVCCERCVLSGRGLCDELIIRPEDSYRLCWVVVCDLQMSWMRRPWPTGGLLHQKKKEVPLLTKIRYKYFPWNSKSRLRFFTPHISECNVHEEQMHNTQYL